MTLLNCLRHSPSKAMTLSCYYTPICRNTLFTIINILLITPLLHLIAPIFLHVLSTVIISPSGGKTTGPKIYDHQMQVVFRHASENFSPSKSA